MVSTTLAANVLAYAKNHAPAMVPKPTTETVHAWARSLNRSYPPQLWEEAVEQWARTADRMICPRDLLEAAKTTVSAWESDPKRGPQLRAHRAQREEEHRLAYHQDRLLEYHGRTARPALETPQVDEDVLDRARRAARGRQ